MTRIELERRAGRFCGLSVSGHSGYAEAGGDIVCAAVSAITELTANGITEIAGVPAELSSDPATAAVRLRLTDGQAQDPLCQAFLAAFFQEAARIAEDYAEYVTINLMEV